VRDTLLVSEPDNMVTYWRDSNANVSSGEQLWTMSDGV
jgi:hypothetical protein